MSKKNSENRNLTDHLSPEDLRLLENLGTYRSLAEVDTAQFAYIAEQAAKYETALQKLQGRTFEKVSESVQLFSELNGYKDSNALMLKGMQKMQTILKEEARKNQEKAKELEKERIAAEKAAAEKERQRIAAEEASKKAAEEAAEKERQRIAAEEAAKQAAEKERQRIAAEEASKKAAEEAAEKERQRIAAEEAAKAAAEKERQRIAAEEAAKQAAEKERQRIAAEEAAKQAAEKERQRIAAEEAAKQAAEKERQRIAAEEAAKQAAEKKKQRSAAMHNEKNPEDAQEIQRHAKLWIVTFAITAVFTFLMFQKLGYMLFNGKYSYSMYYFMSSKYWGETFYDWQIHTFCLTAFFWVGVVLRNKIANKHRMQSDNAFTKECLKSIGSGILGGVVYILFMILILHSMTGYDYFEKWAIHDIIYILIFFVCIITLVFAAQDLKKRNPRTAIMLYCISSVLFSIFLSAMFYKIIQNNYASGIIGYESFTLAGHEFVGTTFCSQLVIVGGWILNVFGIEYWMVGDHEGLGCFTGWFFAMFSVISFFWFKLGLSMANNHCSTTSIKIFVIINLLVKVLEGVILYFGYQETKVK